jgi:hypothetical protein
MILTLQLASAQKAPGTATTLVPRRFVRPPKFWLLPRPRKRASGMIASTLIHSATMAALIWLPVAFPAPIVKDPAKASESPSPLVLEPLVLPRLPEIEDRGSGSVQAGREAARAATRRGARPAPPAAEAPPQIPDFSGPQRIESYVPNPVNRVQTILRPDLVRPPKLKFPLRLQAQVNLPAAAAPQLAPPEQKPQPPAPVAAAPEEVPVAKPTVETPVLTLTPKRASAIHQPEAAPAKAVSPNLRIAAGAKSDALKSVVVLNAVNVTSDGSPIPDAELAGNFVVGPSPEAGATEKSSAGGRGKSPATSSSTAGEGSPSGTAEGGSGVSSISGPTSTVASRGKDAGAAITPASSSGTGSGSTGKAGAGAGSGSGSGSGAPGRGAGNGGTSGISISGGVPGRSSGTTASALLQRSYGMMIISGGNNGGASRDMGVFSRSETVYSVTIPMAGAGGGPDWTMQYALLNPAQASSGLLVPPFVEKKVGATVPKSQFAGDGGPVFITGIIDEKGKLQSLRGIRAQDPRSQSAIRALEQWEFLPAQLDGKSVASKVVIGVTVNAVE